MADIMRVVTSDTNNDFVYSEDGSLHGICLDLWRQIVKDLHIEYNLTILPWQEMVQEFKNGNADVIMQRIDAGLLDNDTQIK